MIEFDLELLAFLGIKEDLGVETLVVVVIGYLTAVQDLPQFWCVTHEQS